MLCRAKRASEIIIGYIQFVLWKTLYILHIIYNVYNIM